MIELFALVSNARKHLVERRQGPLAFEDLFRSEIRTRLEAIPVFPCLYQSVERQLRKAAASLERMSPVAFVGKKVLQRCQ